ncbi:lactonase family protein [Brachybacterium sacelli]|uniref:6-phosphogluconolactonase (Cycloisomerase 2 family) n=1 Tax=Brachybacterium sacelli TaxID=173364 RepID=A0ABS4X3Z8_9MICO|nr:beta-propeller fold lactonase family protein [Brachybacterium sacelli]MBP2383166.1 6-phosphogluconolactonase (cycloisomerase 2 family) [Brachybacterium sacelli]
MSTTATIAVGGYSRSGSGRAPGLELLHLILGDGSDAGERAGAPTVRRGPTIELEDPSFVLWSPDGSLLYAVLETDPTRVVAVRVAEDGSTAELVADLPLEGAGGCHLAPGRTEGTLLVADYVSGTVETVRLDAEGLPVELIDVDHHRDLGDGRQPHPHQVSALPGTESLAVPDLGLDRVFLYRQDTAGQMGLAGEIPLHRGSGPRHLAADHESEQLHISCELSGMVATAVRRPSEPEPDAPAALRGSVHRWSVRSVIPGSETEGDNALSHLELTADESMLLVANRGPDTLSALSLTMMRPQITAEIEVGAHPRHFTQLGDLVLVAAQEGDRIDVLRRDGDELSVAAEPIPAPSASCLAVRP